MSDQAADESAVNEQSFYGWRLVVVLCLVYMAGMSFPLFGAGVINAAMAKALGMNRTTLGTAFSLVVLFTGIPGPLVASMIARFGARVCIVAGTLAIAIAAALIATVVASSWSFIVLFGVVLGSGIAFSTSIPTQAIIAQWFARKRTLAMSLLLLSVGVGAMVASLLLGHIVAITGDWRKGWWVVSGVALTAAFAAAKFVVNRPADIGQVQDGAQVNAHIGKIGEERAPVDVPDWTVRSAVRTPTFWIIAVCAISFYLPLAVNLAHLAVHIVDLGFTAEVGARAFGLIGLGQIIGKVAVGWLGDRLELRRMWAAAMFLMSVAFVTVMNPSAEWVIYAFALALGIGQGISLVVFPTMLANYFGHAAFARLSGVIWPMIEIVASIGPYAAGASFDHFGSYRATFMAMATVLLFAGVLVIFVRVSEASRAINRKR